PLETEGRGHDPLRGLLEIRRLVDQNEVLTSHLEDRPLDPDLAGPDLAGLLADPDSDIAGAGESDDAGFRMLAERGTDNRAALGHEVQNARRHTRFDGRLVEHRRDSRRI